MRKGWLRSSFFFHISTYNRGCPFETASKHSGKKLSACIYLVQSRANMRTCLTNGLIRNIERRYYANTVGSKQKPIGKHTFFQKPFDKALYRFKIAEMHRHHQPFVSNIMNSR